MAGFPFAAPVVRFDAGVRGGSVPAHTRWRVAVAAQKARVAPGPAKRQLSHCCLSRSTMGGPPSRGFYRRDVPRRRARRPGSELTSACCGDETAGGKLAVDLRPAAPNEARVRDALASLLCVGMLGGLPVFLQCGKMAAFPRSVGGRFGSALVGRCLKLGLPTDGECHAAAWDLPRRPEARSSGMGASCVARCLAARNVRC